MSFASLDIISLQPLRNMLLFQYLVSFLEGDFVIRNLAFTGEHHFTSFNFFKECVFVNKILLFLCRKLRLGHFEGVIAQYDIGVC